MSEWISVKEKLPEEGQDVIIAIFDTAKKTYQMMSDSLTFYRNKWVWWTNDPIGNNQDITHWQPLPEPPKKEEQA